MVLKDRRDPHTQTETGRSTPRDGILKASLGVHRKRVKHANRTRGRHTHTRRRSHKSPHTCAMSLWVYTHTHADGLPGQRLGYTHTQSKNRWRAYIKLKKSNMWPSIHTHTIATCMCIVFEHTNIHVRKHTQNTHRETPLDAYDFTSGRRGSYTPTAKPRRKRERENLYFDSQKNTGWWPFTRPKKPQHKYFTLGQNAFFSLFQKRVIDFPLAGFAQAPPNEDILSRTETHTRKNMSFIVETIGFTRGKLRETYFLIIT